MKPFFNISLLSTLWLLATPVYSAPPSADEFLPPIQASTPEQQQQLSQVQDLTPASSPALIPPSLLVPSRLLAS